jgi:hypothetical protein
MNTVLVLCDAVTRKAALSKAAFSIAQRATRIHPVLTSCVSAQ